jgi:hypothetical protein
MKLKVILGYSLLTIVVVCIGLGFGYSMIKLDSDRGSFYECDDIYDIGDCSLYQCKMNYSKTIDRSWMFYDLYHGCLIREKDCVLSGVDE